MSEETEKLAHELLQSYDVLPPSEMMMCIGEGLGPVFEMLNHHHTPPRKLVQDLTCCLSAIVAMRKEGVGSTAARYLLSREIDRLVVEAERVMRKQNKEHKVIDAMLAEPGLLKKKRFALAVDLDCSERVVNASAAKVRDMLTGPTLQDLIDLTPKEIAKKKRAALAALKDI